MKYIAHRGNLYGPNPNEENKPEYLLKAIDYRFYVETDLWVLDDGKLFLGHDEPQYEIADEFLIDIKDWLFCHCKNINALRYMLVNHPYIECFYHKNDDCVLTSKQNIWNYPGTQLTDLSYCVMPEMKNISLKNIEKSNCLGVCTDHIYKYMKIKIE